MDADTPSSRVHFIYANLFTMLNVRRALWQKLQAMDNSHVALVALELPPSVFLEDDGYRCDRNMSLGMNINSLQKIIKCAGNDDEVTLRADESQDTLTLQFSNKGKDARVVACIGWQSLIYVALPPKIVPPAADRIGEYEMKLMDIDQEHLGIPETDYDAHITLPSGEFQKIMRDLKEIGESVRIEVNKEGVKFTAEGDIGNAAVTLRPTEGRSRVKDDDSDEEMQSEEGEQNGVEGEEDEKPDIGSGDEDDGPKPPKRKAAGSGSSKPKKAKTSKSKTNDSEPRRVAIQLTQGVNLTFSVKYLTNFAKSTPLASEVTLSMSNEVPLLVSPLFSILLLPRTCSLILPLFFPRSNTSLETATSPIIWRPRFLTMSEGL
jgi:proliferating cell nuclear antigen